MKVLVVIVWIATCLLWSSTFLFIKLGLRGRVLAELLVARSDASAMLMMGVAEIPVAVILGAVVFGERLPGGTLLGASCVLAAVVAGLTGQPERRASSRDSPEL